jgi:hypothetical protein
MWITKVFKTKEAMQKWLDKNQDRIQWEQIFVNNAWGLIYRKLHWVY